jgi:acetylornithine deacetylase
VPTRATLSFSLRPAPGERIEPLLVEAERRVRAACAPHGDAIEWTTIAARPPLQTRDLASFEPLLGARVAQAVDLDFWTEAAVLAERGVDAVVFGPGAVGQAHAADEFVDIAELEDAAATFARVLR